jgi:predicted Zn-dependent peptidase
MKEDNIKFIFNNDKIFSIQVYIPIGSIHEKKGQYGISHFLEHMKFKKSKNINKKKFMEEFEKIIFWNAYTTKDHTSYYMKSNEEDYKRMITIMYELVFNTSFINNDIDTERKVIEEEKLVREPDIDKFKDMDLEDDLSITSYKNPYNKKIIGVMKDIQKITNKDLEKYNKLYYNDFLVVISCSQKSKNDINKRCLKLFPNSLNKSPKELDNVQSFHYKLIINNLGLIQNKTMLIFKSFNQKNNNKYYLNLIEDILFSTKNSLLTKILREDKGYVYGITGGSESYKDMGCFRIEVSSNSKNSITEIFKILFGELNKLKNIELKMELFNKYKKNYKNKIKYLFKNDDYLITKMGEYLYYDNKFTIDRYTNMINELTPSKLKDIIYELFDYNQMSIITYGNYPNTKALEKRILNMIKKNKK